MKEQGPDTGSHVFVDRTRELQHVREKLGQLKSESSGFLALIRGEAGIGKTALAEQALREIELSDYLVLRGCGYSDNAS